MSIIFEYQNLILFLLGLVFLAFGKWVIRYGGESLLFFLGAVGGFFLYNSFLTKAFIPYHNLYMQWLIILSFGLFLGCLAKYNGVVGRQAELLFLAGLLFFFREKVSQILGIPEWIVSVLGGFLVIFSLPLALAFLATILFFISGVADLFPYGRIIVPALAVAYARIRYGSFFYAGHLKREGMVKNKAIVDGKIPAAVSNNLKGSRALFLGHCNQVELQRLMKFLEKRGLSCEQFPGGYCYTTVPNRLFQFLKLRASGLFIPQPLWVFPVEEIYIPPFEGKSSSPILSVEDAAKKLRSAKGGYLDEKQCDGSNVKIMIADTGVNPVSLRLEKSLIEKMDFLGNGEPSDQNGHGTSVAECALAVAPGAKIVSAKVLDDNGFGSTLSILRALKYAEEHNQDIDLINMSLGGPANPDSIDPLSRAVMSITVPCFAAAGNDGNLGAGTINSPALSPGAFASGSCSGQGVVSPFSSQGPAPKYISFQKPDAINFGENIGHLPDGTGKLLTRSGTSFSSPLSCGVAANILQVRKIGKEVLYRLMCNSALKEGLSPGNNPNYTGSGLVNLKNAYDHFTSKEVEIMSGSKAVREWSFSRSFVKAAIVVGMISILLYIGWFYLDHADEVLTNPTKGEFIMIGRVREIKSGPVVTFDDGTAVISMHWPNPETTPASGSLILLKALRKGDRLVGERRFALY